MTTKKVVKKEDSLVETTTSYRNEMAREKLRKLKLANDHQQLDLSKKEDSLCYRAIAMKEFEKAVSSIYAQIKNADEQLSSLLHLDISQTDILHTYMEQILDALANIEIDLSSTSKFDAEHFYDGTARKNNALSVDE